MKKENKLNLNLAMIQGFYWMAYCCSSSFASVFLLSKDFDNREVGVVLALANVFAVFLQPVVAAYADRSKKVTLKQILCIAAFATTCFSGVLLFIPNVFGLIAILFILIVTGIFVIQPLISALAFEFINRGISVNFGVTRGIGSLSFALFSFALGALIEKKGPGVIPLVSFLLIGGLFLGVVIITDSRKMKTTSSIINQETSIKEDKRKKEEVTKDSGFFSFIKTYRKFLGYLLGILFLFAYHTMFNNYLVHVVTRAGGTSLQMGTTIFIAAIWELPVMGLFGWVLKKTGIRSILYCSAAAFFIKALSGLFAVNMGLLYANQILQMFAFALIIPASVYYVNIIMKEKDRVKGQAYTTTAMTAGGVIGNLLGGTLLDISGVFSMLIACTILAGLGMLFIVIFTQKKGETEYEPS